MLLCPRTSLFTIGYHSLMLTLFDSGLSFLMYHVVVSNFTCSSTPMGFPLGQEMYLEHNKYSDNFFHNH